MQKTYDDKSIFIDLAKMFLTWVNEMYPYLACHSVHAIDLRPLAMKQFCADSKISNKNWPHKNIALQTDTR